MRPLNRTVTAIPPSGIRRFFDLAASLPDVISLGVGEPDFVTPWPIRKAALQSIEKGHTTYTANSGLRQLRELIARDVEKRTGAVYDPDTEIIITVGVSEALDLALRTILDPGDETILFEPCYVSYSPCTALAGGVPVFVSTSADDGFAIDLDSVERAVTSRTKAMLICSPGNPTGAVQSAATLEGLADLAERHDLYVLSDEIYSELVYGQDHASLAEIPGVLDRLVLLGGFSKSHAMTGWRVGYACARAPIANGMLKIHQYTALCAPHVSQDAAIAALLTGSAATEKMRREYWRRRDFMVGALNDMGLTCPTPAGAFYVFPSVTATGLTSTEFAERLLREEGVAVVPGGVFGDSGEGHVRCSYAASLDTLKRAIERIRRFTERCTANLSCPTPTAKVS
ncbi:MAG: aminotransferase class I/II-fold pyridoxal phosphate-dependent enzyme [Chthonomonadales bacterium]|nr:aminotransferase class I/II-fold pyridoxal phosphate-dependent enzyme [Chthonomonadales bacterium]